jgi:hypothetical protein
MKKYITILMTLITCLIIEICISSAGRLSYYQKSCLFILCYLMLNEMFKD